MRRVKPHVAVTFPHDGGYGHPDHIAISQLTASALHMAADSRRTDVPGEPHATAKFYMMGWGDAHWAAYQEAFKKLTSTVAGVERQAKPWSDWELTARGRERMRQFAEGPDARGLQAVWSSRERKAVEAATILAGHLGLEVRTLEQLAENDRSSTGYLPPELFEPALQAFFGEPLLSHRGWETAAAAQQRIADEIAHHARLVAGSDLFRFVEPEDTVETVNAKTQVATTPGQVERELRAVTGVHAERGVVDVERTIEELGAVGDDERHAVRMVAQGSLDLARAKDAGLVSLLLGWDDGAGGGPCRTQRQQRCTQCESDQGDFMGEHGAR